MRNNNSASNDSLKPGVNDSLLLSGPLTFDNVVELNGLGKKMIKQVNASPCVIDLSGVTQAGSAGVSLLLSWARYARARDIQITFRNLPSGLIGVAQVSGIDQILSLEQNHAVS